MNNSSPSLCVIAALVAIPAISSFPATATTTNDEIFSSSFEFAVLPALPPLSNVAVSVTGSNAVITFDPVDDAMDYRVYPMPDRSDISIAQDGHVVVRNAVYRCAGRTELNTVYADNQPAIPGEGIATLVDGMNVDGYTRQLDESTLGYVYTQPDDGLSPVHALGDPAANADDGCYWGVWGASRVKQYTESQALYQQLLTSGWRDDGIAFYVPTLASSATIPLYGVVGSASQNTPTLYYTDAAEALARAGVGIVPTTPFVLLSNPAPGAQPLMRAYYQNACGRSHDELAVGLSRFNRVRYQGNHDVQQPYYDQVHWSGVTGQQTLVVEALDSGCPFQGFLSTSAVPAETASGISHQQWFTLQQQHANSPTGEVFVNGQYDVTTTPRAIARSFVTATPQPRPVMDWSSSFANSTEQFTSVPCDEGSAGCFQAFRYSSQNFDTSFDGVETDQHAIGNLLGEMWVTYADWAADTAGILRMTAKQRATMASVTYLHVTMQVDSISSDRRYPQIIISNQDAPLQYNLPQGNALILESFEQGGPNVLQIEVCDHYPWNVNNHCPHFNLHHSDDQTFFIPNADFTDHTAADRNTQYDLYASTSRAYVFLDGQPFGCANLPAAGVPPGPVTVSYGDVLYHSGVDVMLGFHARHMQIETRRHFDNLGFSSGVAAPSWDESRYPCSNVLNPGSGG